MGRGGEVLGGEGEGGCFRGYRFSMAKPISGSFGRGPVERGNAELLLPLERNGSLPENSPDMSRAARSTRESSCGPATDRRAVIRFGRLRFRVPTSRDVEVEIGVCTDCSRPPPSESTR